MATRTNEERQVRRPKGRAAVCGVCCSPRCTAEQDGADGHICSGCDEQLCDCNCAGGPQVHQ